VARKAKRGTAIGNSSSEVSLMWIVRCCLRSYLQIIRWSTLKGKQNDAAFSKGDSAVLMKS
jgi:hypothetical protein